VNIKKTYKVCISFGDGKPVNAEITAKTGYEAINLAYSLHPGSRNVHILKTAEAPIEEIHPFFAPPVVKKLPLSDGIRDQQVDLCIRMRTEGKTHDAIAGLLGVGKTTVGRWLKQYG